MATHLPSSPECIGSALVACDEEPGQVLETDIKPEPTPPRRWEKYLVFAVFVGLGVSIKLTQHGARNLQYNFLCPIIVVSLSKLTCSLVLYARFDGSLAQLPVKLLAARPVVLRYSVVAGLFCLYDVLSFVNLTVFDPQTYCVLLQLRTVGTGVVWEIAFAKPLGWMKRGGLTLIFFSCVAKHAAGGLHLEQVSPQSYALLFLQVAANCLAGVANELLLKSRGAVPLNLQNAVQYTWTVLWCLLVGILCPLEGVHLNPLDFAEWVKMGDIRMIPIIAILTLLGLVTSVFLKLMDSVWKAIATAVELFLTAFGSAAAFGYPVRITDFAALCVAAAGVGLYAQPEVVQAPLKNVSPS